MPDPTFYQFLVSRPVLGLPDLNINDHVKYVVSSDIMGGTITWRRQSVQSPYVEGEITVSRVRGVVEDKFSVDVLGVVQSDMQQNVADLIAAFTQDNFNMTIRIDDATYTWVCEACDYSMDWSVPRMHGLKTQVKFSLRRSPIPINGPV